MSAEAKLHAKAEEHHVPFEALMEVYKKGIGAWKSNPESVRLLRSGKKNYSPSRAGKMPKEMWAMARVNAFLEKRPSVYTGADDSIRRKYHLK